MIAKVNFSATLGTLTRHPIQKTTALKKQRMPENEKKIQKIMLKTTIAVAVIQTSVALITLNRTSLSIAIGAIVVSILIWAKLKKDARTQID